MFNEVYMRSHGFMSSYAGGTKLARSILTRSIGSSKYSESEITCGSSDWKITFVEPATSFNKVKCESGS